MSDAAAPAAPTLRPTLGYAPSMFLERGVWVPFTTPQLAGARVRPSERNALELIIPNPSGARGVYIVPWGGIFALCSPTVHDRVLNTQLEGARGVTPSLIRRLALDVAQDGLAGRQAAASAEATRKAESELVTLTNFDLLMRLMKQTDEAAGQAGEAIEDRARDAVAVVARRLAQAPETVAAALEEMAGLYAPLGVGGPPGKGRLVIGKAALTKLRTGIEATLAGPPGMANTDADLVVASADLTLACLRKTVGDALALLDDLPGLLLRWFQDAEELAARLARPDWLLDGWDRICLLWSERVGDIEGCLAELADLVPATPKEAASWIGKPVESFAGVLRVRRRVNLQQDWRSGATVLDLVARNEHLRALSPGSPA